MTSSSWLDELERVGKNQNTALLTWIGQNASRVFAILSAIHAAMCVDRPGPEDEIMNVMKSCIESAFKDRAEVDTKQLNSLREECRAIVFGELQEEMDSLRSQLRNQENEKFDVYKSHQTEMNGLAAQIAQLTQERALLQQSLMVEKNATTVENKMQFEADLAKMRETLEIQKINRYDVERQYEMKISQMAEEYAAEKLKQETAIGELKMNHQRELVKVANLQKLEYEQNVGQFLTKYTSASPAVKGACGELAYTSLLNDIFPTAEVLQTHKTNHCCDIRLSLSSDFAIMLEIKNYSSNVPTKEVLKFKRDINERKEHGILVSQTTGIALKSDQEVEILENGLVVVYLTNNKLDAGKIKAAVATVRAIASIHECNRENGTGKSITGENMMAIVKQLNGIAAQNDRIKADLKNHIAQLDNAHVEQIRLLLGIASEGSKKNIPTKTRKKLVQTKLVDVNE